MEVHAKPVCVVSLSSAELRLVGLGLIGNLTKPEDQKAALVLNARLMRSMAREAQQLADQSTAKAEMAEQLAQVGFEEVKNIVNPLGK